MQERFMPIIGIAWLAASAFGQCPGCRAADECPPACYARPSDTGSPCRGDAPAPDEGVWGWDYSGACFWPRIALLWNHGRRYQGGPGAYRTDGPRLLQEHQEKKGD
jgi:hypothetical protein